MNTKLTLSLEKEVIDRAKVYAQQHGKSLSDLIGGYLKSITEAEEKEAAYTPLVRSLLGSVKLPEDFDYKAEITSHLENKYLK